MERPENRNRMQIAVLDADPAYVQRLTDYMNSRHGFPFEAEAFTDTDRLCVFLQKRGPDVVVVSESLFTDELRSLIEDQTGCRLILLCEEKEKENEDMICKYQPADRLIERILHLLSGRTVASPDKKTKLWPKQQPEPQRPMQREPQRPMQREMQREPQRDLKPDRRAAREQELQNRYERRPPRKQLAGYEQKRYAVFSPIGRCGKTGFALALGMLLAGDRKVLYLNLEDYSSFPTGASGTSTGDITDLLYYLREDPGAMIYRMGNMIRTIGNLDYIPPAFSAEDLADVKAEEWLFLMDEITGTGEYDTFILDIGMKVRQVYSLLRSCTAVFMPVLPDPVSRSKVNEFMRIAGAMGMPDPGRRIITVRTPAVDMNMTERNFPQELVSGQMGDHVRKLIRSGVL